jgi:ABC-type dipeptide/oligopeptide/nickel transport system ATPase subunit
MTALLQARDATVRYPGSHRDAVIGADLEIASRAAIGIVGESGSGKTTLGHALVGTLRPTRGEVLVDGVPWARVGRKADARRRVQMIFQDPLGALNPWLSARDAVAEAVRHWHGHGREEARGRAGDLLAETGLSREAMDRHPKELSGGQCQRVGIARALACEPAVIVADEPTSALDVSVQAQILNLLVALQESHDLALVLISHDLSVIRHMTDDAVVMYGGRIVERGPTGDLMERPAHPYTRLLVDPMSDSETLSSPLDPAAGGDDHPCPFAARCPAIQPDCDRVLADPGPKATVLCRHPLRRPEPAGTAAR